MLFNQGGLRAGVPTGNNQFIHLSVFKDVQKKGLYVGHHVVWDRVQRKLFQDLSQDQTEQEGHRKLDKEQTYKSA